MMLPTTAFALDLVWLGIGLLYYPAQLMFWDNIHDAIVMIVVYIIMMVLFIRPLFQKSTAAA